MRSNINDLGDDQGNVYWWRILKFLVAFLFIAMLFGVIGRFLGWGAGWLSLPSQKYSVENVQREYAWFYGMHQQIRVTRLNVEALEAKQASLRAINGDDTTRWPAAVRDAYTQTAQQVLQLQTALNAACGEYQSRWQNVFHSMAAPSDIPRTCDAVP